MISLIGLVAIGLLLCGVACAAFINVKRIVLISLFLLPIPLSSVMCISFSDKLSTGGIVAFLAIAGYFIHSVKGRYKVSGLDYLILGLIVVKVIFFMVAMIRFNFNPIDNPVTYSQFKALIQELFCMFAFFVFSFYFQNYTKPLRYSGVYLMSGMLTLGVLIIGIFVMCYVGGKTTGIYETRDLIFVIARKYKATLEQGMTGIGWIGKSVIILELQTAVGPFLSFGSVFSFIVYSLARREDKGLKLFSFIVGGICLLGFLLIASRSGVLSFLIGMLLFYSVFYRKYAKRISAPLIGLFISLIFLFVFVPNEYNFVARRLFVQDIVAERRVELWAKGLLLFLNNPFGYGHSFIGNVNFFGEYRMLPDVDFTYSHVHNEYLRHAINYGIFGITFLFMIILITVKRGYIACRRFWYFREKLSERDRIFPILAVSALFGFVTMLIHLIFNTLHHGIFYSMAFWIVIALINGLFVWSGRFAKMVGVSKNVEHYRRLVYGN